MQQVMMDKLNVCIFLIEDDDLSEKYNAVWDKVSADIKKELDNLAHNKNLLKTKMKNQES